MASGIVGRDAELASVRAFVGNVADGAAALALEGEAGMGKTTVWNAALEHAGEQGALVLRARPSASETTLSFSGIGDLLDPVLDRALDPLPEPQRRALARALVLEDDAGPPPDPRSVGVAVLNVLRTLASEQPVVVAVDDVQWLDSASSGALAYAARRLGGDRVGLLVTRRSGLDSALVDELRSLRDDRFAGLAVGPLDVATLHRVVQAHLDAVLPRPLLAEVHAAAGGNPFFALEIVRTLRRSGASVEAGHPLPVPESLHDLVHNRLLLLPPESRDFLLAAAAHAHPTVSITEAASGVGHEAGLRPALEARVVMLEGDRIGFMHPLLAAGAYEVADPLRRSEVHARLAELLENPEARAWQLAASVTEPDEAVAAVLEEAAGHARARGAPRAAALLLDRARELTPAHSSELACRRAIEAAFLHFESGDSRRAEPQLAALVTDLVPGALRARALVRLARVRSYESQEEAVGLFLQAVDEADGELDTLAAAHEGVAACFFRLRKRLHDAVEHAVTAARIAESLGDEALAAEATGTQLIAETLLGSKSASETAERALARQDACRDRRVLSQPLLAVSVHWWWTDRAEEARAALLELLERGRELGDESSLPYVLVLLGRVECQLGLYESAAHRARDGQEAADQSGQSTLSAYNLALAALAAAHLGDVERAREAAANALERVPETGGRPAELLAREALAQLEVALRSPEAVVAVLEPAVAFVRSERSCEPGALRIVPDHVEALVELGRAGEAVELLDWYEGNARRLGRASAVAASLRCRGLLAAQDGRHEDALEAYREALALHAAPAFPLDRARTLLALGATLRRAKRRREARETLEDALAACERIRAALWVERARDELRRISGRAPSLGALTPAEERVAALVAEGKTNREVAAALYLSERTVEGHLSRVFGKLGIRHRTQVARALATRQTEGDSAPNTGNSPVSAGPSAP